MTRSLPSNKVVFALFLALFLGMGTANAHEYSFSAVCSSGQTLYYNIIDATNHYVEITCPGPEGYAWSGYSQPTGNITLPSTVSHDGVTYTVKRIGDNAFEACWQLTGSLTIPNTVTEIGMSAFAECTGFTGTLTIGNSVTTIGPSAFEGCDGLTGSLTIPDSVTEIGDFAFYRCSAINGTLTIGTSVTKIDEFAFGSMTFSHVYFNATNCLDYGGAFKFTHAYGLTFGNNVEYIPSYFCVSGHFFGTLTIGTSVETIGDHAFEDCVGFTGPLYIPNSVVSIGDYAFDGCEGFTSLTLGNYVATIGSSAFNSCTGFTDVGLTIPNSVSLIGSNAFYNCTGFTGSLTIGNAVEYIGYAAFRNCSGFTQVYYTAINCADFSSSSYNPFDGCGGSFYIGNYVQRIPSNCLNGCTGFTGRLVIGSSVTEIGAYAFGGCSNFTSITAYPETPPHIGTTIFDEVPKTIPLNVPCSGFGDYKTATGWSEFTNIHRLDDNCDLLTYSINDDGISVTVTGHVDGTSATGALVIPETKTINGVTYTVTAIGEQAFINCYYLTGALNIPYSVTTIGRGAFYYCVGFTSLTLGKSVTTIEEFAFSNCENLTGSLTLPSSVTTLGNGAFGYTDFTSITSCPEMPPTSSTYTFQNVPTDIPVTVPCGSLEDYKTATGWSAFTNWQCECLPHSLPYTYGFENAGEMGCWTLLNCADYTGLLSTIAHEGSTSFRFYYNSNPPQYLISPEFDGTSAMIVSFYYKNSSDRYPETFRVGYSTTTQSPTAFTWYDEVTANDQTTWMRYEDYFPEGTKYVAVKLTSYDELYLYLDDFSFEPVSCDEPSNLTVTNITSNSAEVHWTGEQESYNVRYRTVPDGSWIVKTPQPNSFMDDFENGIGNWTLIDADGDGKNWFSSSTLGINGAAAHGGSGMAFSFSWQGGLALTPDNYLVTPCVTLGGTVTFWASAEDLNDAAEHFGIAVSTGSNTNPADFTMVQEWTMTAKGGGQGGPRGNRDQGTWYQYTVDLSAYAGQTGYIALRHFDCTNQFALAVDDFSYNNEGFTDGFENGLGQWTLIDADGDHQNWKMSEATAASPHGGDNMVVSYSWYGGQALTPNNYLVTPQVVLGGTVTFWACAVDPVYSMEHFGVAVSTNSNTDPADFTLVSDWTMISKGEPHDGPRGSRSQGTWYEYTVDLSAYAGQTGYIALRHFNCTDQCGLFVDDFSYDGKVIPTGITLGGLSPATTYEVQVQGICQYGLTEWSVPVTFTTGSSSVTQTTELSAGWNWFSTYIEADPVELLQMLEDGLGENGIVIKGGDITTEYDEEWGWFGDLDEVGIVNEQMYLVRTAAACTVVMEGIPANPADHAITIKPGWNWIGFPCSVSVGIEDAFSGFNAAQGDGLKYGDISTEYDEEWGWFGDIETLVPGQGYLYFSNASSPKTLVFQTGAKARRE